MKRSFGRSRIGYLIFMMVLVTVLLSGCGKKKPAEPEKTPPATQIVVEEPTALPAEAPTEAPTEVSAEIPAETPTELPAEASAEAPTEPEVSFEDVEETVYATADVNIRTGPGKDYDRVRVLKQGKSVKRIGIGANGWSKVLVDGETYYISSKYLTAKKPEAEGVDFSRKPDESEGFLHSHPMGTTVRYDLNGDGIGENITVTAQEYAEGRVTVGKAEIKFQAACPTGYYSVLNVDQSGKTLLIAVSDYGMSDDYITVLYAYDGEKITEIGYFEDIIGQNTWDISFAICHGDGTISARKRFDVLGTWNAMARYRADGKSLKDITELYRYVSWEGKQDGWDVTAKTDIVMYEDIRNPETELMVPAGTSLSMIGIKKSGTEGMYLVRFDVDAMGITLWMTAEMADWMTYVPSGNGLIISEEAFDGFFYAG